MDDDIQRANQQIGEAYDKRVYTSNAFPYCSPGHLRAAAHLYGLDSVPLESARVLELGCAGGGNLLPFALAYPNAHVVGVDLSAVQISQGRDVVKGLGVRNLHLHAMSLTEITADFGHFDYIIAHGVFSWVPAEVRDAMLRILRQNMSPLGIGYVSYNTYPGWKAGDVVRDAMLLHSHSAQTDESKLASAKAVLNLLSEGIASSNSLAPSLRSAVAQLRQHSDYYIAHEYLEAFNNPCYLLEFVNLVDQHGLAHVGDAEPHSEMSVTYGQNVQLHHSLVALGQPREWRQQYLDFAVGRNFRKSLVVHADRGAAIFASPAMERLANFRWAGYFKEVAAEENTAAGVSCFRNHKNRLLQTRDPVVLAVVTALSAAWPASVDFSSLVEAVGLQLGHEDDGRSMRASTLEAVQTLFRFNLLRFTRDLGPYDVTSGSRQETVAVIPGFAHLYHQCKNPQYGIGMFNLWHDVVNIQLNEAEECVLDNINGKRTPKQLATMLRDAFSSGEVPSPDGRSLKGQRNLDGVAKQIVDKSLSFFRQHGLLLTEE